jgi:hypothetical protein
MLVALVAVSCDDNDPPPGTTSYPPETSTTSPPAAKVDSARELTRLYCLAATNPDQVPSFVRENQDAFADVAQLQQCAAAFRQQVIATVIRSPSRDEIYGHALNVAGSNPELGRLAGKVANDHANGLADLMLLSDHLTALANSVDGMLKGNDGPYHQTFIYQGMKLVYDMGAAELLGPEYLAYVAEVGYQSIYPLVAMACR